MLRSGLLTSTWVPDREHEALRDLVRAREDAVKDGTRARQRLGKFLLRLGVRAPDSINPWTKPYLQWLARLQMGHAAQQVVLEEYRQDIEESMRRVVRFEREIEACVTTGDHAAVVAALQAMRGVKLVTAASIVAEVGDIRRFRTPRQLMAYAGMVPSEHSSGSHTRRGAMTKSGNAHLRRAVIESGWHYRHKPVVSDCASANARRRRQHVRSHGRRSSGCTSDTTVSSSGGSFHRRRWSQSGVSCWDSSGRSRWLLVLPCNVRRRRKAKWVDISRRPLPAQVFYSVLGGV